MLAQPPSTARPGSRWLLGPVADSALVAWCWVPFYLFFVGVLGLGRGVFGADGLPAGELRAATATAAGVVLALTWVHRHYTFLLVYGDGPTFKARARGFLLAPAAVLLAVVLARWGRGVPLGQAGKLTVTPWLVLLTVSGAWNVWHTIQQRYGILRVYGAKADPRLRGPEAGRRDRAMLWGATLLVAGVLLLTGERIFTGHPAARRFWLAAGPLARTAWGQAPLAGAVALGLLALVRWVGAERKVAPGAARGSFVLSTWALLAVFLVHGPIVGYLSFAVAHAVEYLAFVHAFARGKVRSEGGGGPGLRALAAGWPGALALVLVLGGGYLLLAPARRLDLYLVYYFATSLLHFLYDGWIWKVRKPQVARPLRAGV